MHTLPGLRQRFADPGRRDSGFPRPFDHQHRGVPVQKLPHFENQARRGGPMKARKAATMASTAGGVPVPAGTTKTL